LKPELPLSARDVERVGLKLFEIVEREINANTKQVNPEKLMIQAIRESGFA
jgi:hypothetical protein